VLIPTALTGIPANEPRAGKIYELTVGGTCTTGTAGTLIIQPRYGLVIGGTALGVSPTQNRRVPVSRQPIYLSLLACHSVNRPAGHQFPAVCSGTWTSGGAVVTAHGGDRGSAQRDRRCNFSGYISCIWLVDQE
jgi:hypothetical protein